MKKTLALILSLLVAFSMFTVAAFAEGETTDAPALISVVFLGSDGEEYKVLHVAPGASLTSSVPENPVKADTATTKYTFRGWKSNIEGDNEWYYKNTLPDAPSAEAYKSMNLVCDNEKYDGYIIYTADYVEEEIAETQSFWNFIQSIFARINLIFEYFATIFDFSDRD